MKKEERDAVKSILSNHCYDRVMVTDNTLLEDLGYTSLETMLVIIEIEDELKIKIEYSKILGVKTVGQLIESIALILDS